MTSPRLINARTAGALMGTMTFGYAEGRYYRRCMTCAMAFTGSKRSLRCRHCATAAADEWTTLSPAQQAARRQ